METGFITKCRVCENAELSFFLDLENTPLANRLLTSEQLSEPEPEFPLGLCWCNDCKLVQLSYTVDPKVLFEYYLYVTPTSTTIDDHIKWFVKETMQKFSISSEDTVVEMGSNTGRLLQEYKNHNISVRGVEPAKNLAELAESNGIPTWADFFNYETAKRLKDSYPKIKLLIGRHVFAHISDLSDVLKGIKLLADDGCILAVEAPYLMDILTMNEFDTVYHEHIFYFSLTALRNIFSRFGLVMFDYQRVSLHGGSIVIYVGAHQFGFKESDRLRKGLSQEQHLGFHTIDPYNFFAMNTVRLKNSLVHLLKSLKAANKSIVGYGAPAKGNTLLNYCGIGKDELDYVVDNTEIKQGRFLPGTHLPILSDDEFRKDYPDVALLLAWNFASEIIKKESEFLKQGGKFILPVPNPILIP